jgi:mannan endo-1,4-beta-mannosidase
MKFKVFLSEALITLMLILACSVKAQEPATPNASTEARALLKYMQSLSGKYILAGQHNYPMLACSTSNC